MAALVDAAAAHAAAALLPASPKRTRGLLLPLLLPLPGCRSVPNRDSEYAGQRCWQKLPNSEAHDLVYITIQIISQRDWLVGPRPQSHSDPHANALVLAMRRQTEAGKQGCSATHGIESVAG
jgi:hypothetical protein